MRIIILIFIVFSGFQTQALHLPVPVFKHISVEEYPEQKVFIEWICPDTSLIDGYILYRTVYDQSSVADSAFMPLAEINKKNTCTFTDISFINQNPNIGLHHYAYKIASFKRSGTEYEYSELSQTIAPFFIKKLTLQNCNSEILVEWSHAIGAAYQKMQLKIMTLSQEYYISASESDRQTTIKINDYEGSQTESADSIKLCFKIMAEINGKNSFSNQLCLLEARSEQTNIAIDSVIVNGSNTEIHFNAVLENLPAFWLFQTFENNRLVHTDSLGSAEKLYKAPFNAAQEPKYQILAINPCKQIIGQYAYISPLVIKETRQLLFENTFEMATSKLFSATENVQKTTLYAAGLSSPNFEDIETLNYIPDYWQDNNIEAAAAKKYFVKLETYNQANGGFQTSYQSNILNLYKETKIEIPNAIYLLSPIETDKYFQIKCVFCSSFTIEIFDIKGISLFNSDDIQFKWQPSNSKQTTDYAVYYYLIKYKNTKGLVYTLKDRFLVFQ